MESYGQLVLSRPEGEEQVFELIKESLSLGRVAENDIPLRDGKVSRTHARLEYEGGSVYINDLGSVNGTFVNNARVQRARLSAGDMIRLGDSMLRFEGSLLKEEVFKTLIDSPEDLTSTLLRETLVMSINDTSRARIVIMTSDLTWEVPLVGERWVIGRSTDADIHIPQSKISRQHAQIERYDDNFVIRDLGSSNGTWMGNDPVETHSLRNGDTVRIGSAKLVFKSPFEVEHLTMMGTPEADRGPRKPVIFVPGMMGSKLGIGGDLLWPNVRTLFTNPEIFTLPQKAPMEVMGIVDEVVVVPSLIKSEQYSRFGDYLVEGLGYTRGKDLYEFGYDWRFDVREAARKLAQYVESAGYESPIALVAHSLGTLVSRYYVEKLGGKNHVDRLILMGGPHRGVPKAIGSLAVGPDLLPFGMMGDRMRKVVATFPTTFQILPEFPCVVDQHGTTFSVLEDENWLPEDYVPLLRSAREFRRELGHHSSVPTLSIFGYGKKTISTVRVERNAEGAWNKVDMETTEQGDDSIPEHSGILDGTDIHPVQQFHGSLYIDNDVKMRLKVELTRPYR